MMIPSSQKYPYFHQEVTVLNEKQCGLESEVIVSILPELRVHDASSDGLPLTDTGSSESVVGHTILE